MSKIDYSQFYMKNYFPDSVQKKAAKPVAVEKKKKKIPFMFLALLLIITLIGVNFLLEGKPYETVKSWVLRDNSTYYYLLTKSFDKRDTAYAQSILIRQLGASGYIYQSDGKYLVIYSVYTTEENASAVADKNAGTEITKKKTDSKSPFYEKVSLYINQIISVAEEFEAGIIYEAKLLETCSIIKTNLTEEKQKLVTEGNSTNEYMTILEIMIGGLSSLNIPSPTRVNLLSDLRYIASSAIMSLPSV